MSLLASIYRWFECPPRLVAVREAVARQQPLVLDVGCGNHSASVTRRHVPSCVYHGVDRAPWNVDQRDAACTDALFEVDLDEPAGLSVIDDARYDAVLCSHVLEHLGDPYTAIRAVAHKVRPCGGVLYVEVPSPQSACFPRASRGWCGIKGCLNFFDDPTHRTMVDLPRVAELLRADGFLVSPVRHRFLWRRVLLLPLYAAAGLLLRGYIPASVFWEATGFALCLVAQRP